MCNFDTLGEVALVVALVALVFALDRVSRLLRDKQVDLSTSYNNC
jgi:hypothetical protein